MIEFGRRIDDRYRVDAKIATGGMADVYEGYDLIRKKRVALKIMREDMMENPANIERFHRESVASSSLNNPNIVKVLGQGTIDGRPYLVNEYVEGRTLREKLQMTTGHRLSAQEACEVMLQLTNGIQYIHEHGLIHRDIKPENLFYLPDGSIKVTDFGISTEVGEKTPGDRVTGTVLYTAPEILMGGESTVTSDVYSMGILFFEILVGRVPFDGKTPEDIALAQIKNHIPAPSSIIPECPKVLDKITAKACRKRPEERYQSAAALGHAIELVLHNADNFKEHRGFFKRLFGWK